MKAKAIRKHDPQTSIWAQKGREYIVKKDSK